jgi:hypothetical protein
MLALTAAAQPLETGKVDLRAYCDIHQPDHDERGDLIVRYSDDKAYKTIAGQLTPMLVDMKVLSGRGGDSHARVCACVRVSLVERGG